MRIFVRNLAHYNAGDGKCEGWVHLDLCADEDQLMDVINGIVDPDHVEGAERPEWAVHDYSNFPNMGEHPDVAAMAEIATWIDSESDGSAIEAFEAFAKANGGCDVEWSEILDTFQERYRGFYDNLEAWAMERIGDEVTEKLGETLAGYFDYEYWGRDAELGGDIDTIQTTGGIFVFSST